MRLRPRLWLFGAVLPTLGLALTILVAGELFRLSLVQSVDEAMLAQASVERVSLFDGPSGEPHLVPHDEADADTLEHPSIVSVYDAAGEALIQFPHRLHAPDHIDWQTSAETDVRTSRDEHGHDVRELRTVVRSSNGKAYLLRLASPLRSIEDTVSTFYRTTLSVGLVVALVLFAVQALQAHALVRRIRTMTDYLPKLRDGVLDLDALPSDPSRDELAEQRDALAEAATRVQRAREAQDRLIANAAHELRTPLTIMRTQMDLALRRERSADELRAALDASRAEVDRLAYLASRLLDLAAVSRVARELRSGDLVELVNESVLAYRATADDVGISIEVHTPQQATATFDRSALRQALDNLLANACKHGPAHGVVIVTLERVGAAWHVTVRDSGAGVAEEHAEKVFEPFYRLGGTKQGAGLGLAITREIARAHGGDAWVRGAAFTMSLA